MNLTEPYVLALILVRDQPELLQDCLDALSTQSRKPDSVRVLDLRGNSDASPLVQPAALGLEISLESSTRLTLASALSSAALESSITQGRPPDLVWLLQSDAIPNPQSLGELVRRFEVSPSLAILSPKLLHRDQSRRIESLGITVSASGELLNRHADEYDQGQFDSDSDVFAANPFGALYRADALADLKLDAAGNSELMIGYASAVQLRSRGQRVAVSPRAWVSRHPVPVSGFEKRRVSFALRLSIWPSWLIWVQVLFLPLEALLRSIRSILAKQPQAVPIEFWFWLWYWLTLPTRFAEMRRLMPSDKPTRALLRPLLATRAQLAMRRQAIRIDPREQSVAQGPGLMESGSFWFALIPLLAALPLLPMGAIAQGIGQLPLSPSLAEIFDSLNLAASEGWLYSMLLIAAILPSSPSQDLAWVVFLAPVIAYLSSWQLLRRFSGATAFTVVSALSYSLAPALLISRYEGWSTITLAVAVLPWLLLSLVKLFDSQSASRSWRQAGLAGLLLALTSGLTPMVLVLALALTLAMASLRPARSLWFVAALVPAIVLVAPRVIALAHDPTTLLLGWHNLGSHSLIWQVFNYEWVDSGLTFLVALVILAVVVVVALPSRTGFVVFLLAIGLLAAQLVFAEASIVLQISATLVLLLSVAIGLQVESLGSVKQRSLATWSMLFIGLLAIPTILRPVDLDWSASDRVLPAIVHAAAAVDSGVLTLQLSISGEEVETHLEVGNGTHLDQSIGREDSFALNQDLPLTTLEQAELAAALVAGAVEPVSNLLAGSQISFVLLTTPSAEVTTNINSLGLLESAGVTERGQLWRVAGVEPFQAKAATLSGWVVATLTLLALYLLLALPTPGSIRKSRGDSSIFLGGEEG